MIGCTLGEKGFPSLVARPSPIHSTTHQYQSTFLHLRFSDTVLRPRITDESDATQAAQIGNTSQHRLQLRPKIRIGAPRSTARARQIQKNALQPKRKRPDTSRSVSRISPPRELFRCVRYARLSRCEWHEKATTSSRVHGINFTEHCPTNSPFAGSIFNAEYAFECAARERMERYRQRAARKRRYTGSTASNGIARRY